jgi:hypothetical protein
MRGGSPRGWAARPLLIEGMLSRPTAGRALAAALLLTGIALPTATLADDGVDHAFELRRMPSGMSLGSSFEPLTLSAFDPGDPRVGLTLIAAYGPTPLLFIEGVAADAAGHRPFTIVELVAASIGSAASAWGLADALSREGEVNVAIGSLATAHALSWNLELMTDALTRLVFSGSSDAERERPTFLVFPVNGGAGITLRWES